MKKGIVMEKHRRYMIVMQNDGSFHKAPPMESVTIGTEVTYEPLHSKSRSFFYTNNKNFPLKPVAMFCVLLLLLVPIYFTMGVNKTYAYVSIDINPSIELEINKDLQVRSMVAVNEDGEKILEHLTDYKGKKLGKVISLIMQKSEDIGLIENGKNMLLGVSYALDDHDKSVLDTVDKYFLENGQDWQIATFIVPKKLHKLALEKKLSMNEVMVSKMNDTNYTNKQLSLMDEKEKAIIDSFYNKKIHSDTTTADDKGTDKTEKNPDSNESDTVKETDQPNESKEKKGDMKANDNRNQDADSGSSEDNHSGKAKGHHKDNSGESGNQRRNPGKAKGHYKDNPGKAKGHYKNTPGKAKGHHKDNPGKAKKHRKWNPGNGGHHKNNPGKAKGHRKWNPGNGHHEDNPGKAKEHRKWDSGNGHHEDNPGKAKGHRKWDSGNGHHKNNPGKSYHKYNH